MPMAPMSSQWLQRVPSPQRGGVRRWGALEAEDVPRSFPLRAAVVAEYLLEGLGFGVWDLGFGVKGLGFRVEGVGCRA